MKNQVIEQLRSNKSGQVIGFATVMYTLYNYEITEIMDHKGYPTGEFYCYCSFVKNISSDINKVKALYPDLKIDETLHGHIVSYKYGKSGIEEPRETPVHEVKFPFGKHKGGVIVDCPDAGYIAWVLGNNVFHGTPNAMAAVAVRAEQLGIKEFNHRFWTPEEMESDEYRNTVKFIETIESGNPFEVIFDRNLDICGHVYNNRFEYAFNEYKEMGSSYYGMYSLPVVNGKAKRIKNKAIKVTDYAYNGWLITINSWEFVK